MKIKITAQFNAIEVIKVEENSNLSIGLSGSPSQTNYGVYFNGNKWVLSHFNSFNAKFTEEPQTC